MGNVLAGTMDPGCSSMVLVTKQHKFNPYGGAWFAGVPPLYNLRPAARAAQHPGSGWSVSPIWGGSCRFRVVWPSAATGTRRGCGGTDGADGWDGWPAAGTHVVVPPPSSSRTLGRVDVLRPLPPPHHWHACRSTGPALSAAQGLALQAAGPFVLGVDSSSGALIRAGREKRRRVVPDCGGRGSRDAPLCRMTPRPIGSAAPPPAMAPAHVCASCASYLNRGRGGDCCGGHPVGPL